MIRKKDGFQGEQVVVLASMRYLGQFRRAKAGAEKDIVEQAIHYMRENIENYYCPPNTNLPGFFCQYFRGYRKSQ